MNGASAPAPGWRVRIVDQSGGAEDGIVEDVAGFASLEQASEFARRYVRDSLERCRAPGLGEHEVVEAWFAFGEDALLPDAPEGEGWDSAAELARFAAEPASAEERDWRALDPRRRPA